MGFFYPLRKKASYTEYLFSAPCHWQPLRSSCQGSCYNKRQTKVLLRERKTWGSVIPSPLQTELGYCNSQSKYIFTVGDFLLWLLRPIQEISFKYRNEHTGSKFLFSFFIFFKQAHRHTHTTEPQLRCMAYSDFFTLSFMIWARNRR